MKPGKRNRLSIKRVEQAIRSTGGIRVAAAQRLGVSRSTLYRFFEQHPQLVEFANEVDEELKDVAESQVVKAITAGDMPTVRWYLETKGKDRGYSRRVESTGPDGGPVPVKPDLSKLSDEELEILLRAAERREAAEKRGEQRPSTHGIHRHGQACDCGSCASHRRPRKAA